MLAEKLVAAARRGVDVRVVITLRGNVERLNRYVAVTANRLWRGGVKVYLAPGMTHRKVMSVDGVWAYLGTGNFDELSLRNNREAGVTVLSASLVGGLDRQVLELAQARAERLQELLPLPANLLWLELMKLWF
ncbi:MAG: phospholipase D-like domain-containing protein [Isosphaeraceae bacterium]